MKRPCIHTYINTKTQAQLLTHVLIHAYTHIVTHMLLHTHTQTNLTILHKTYNFKNTSKSYIISSLNHQNSQKCRISSSKHIEYIIKMNIIELERWLRAQSVLTENLSSFSSTCIGWLTTNCNSIYNGVWFLCLPEAPYTYMHVPTHIYSQLKYNTKTF